MTGTTKKILEEVILDTYIIWLEFEHLNKILFLYVCILSSCSNLPAHLSYPTSINEKKAKWKKNYMTGQDAIKDYQHVDNKCQEYRTIIVQYYCRN